VLLERVWKWKGLIKVGVGSRYKDAGLVCVTIFECILERDTFGVFLGHA